MISKRARARRPTEGDGLALKLFDEVFGPTWAAWRAWLCAVLALPMSDAEAATFRTCTSRTTLPTSPAREAWNVVGRRGGKSRIAAFVAVFLAAFRKYPQLAPGERAVVLVIAPDRRQSRVVFGYVLALLESIPALASLVGRQTADTIELTNGASITIGTASFKTVRGYTIVAVVLDEVAFFEGESSANPDVEILRAIRPSLSSVPGSLLVAISSPYAARGELFKNHDRYFGRDDADVLVWQSASIDMNPSLSQAMIDREFEEDPAAASAEWSAIFRSDLEQVFTREALDAVVVQRRFELAPAPGIAYIGFVDTSGGSSESMALAIAHRDAVGIPVLDLVREVRAPFVPAAVVKEFAGTLKLYGLSKVIGDRYGSAWVSSSFVQAGISYEPCALTKSELFLELLPMVNSGRVELLDNSRLIGQLAGLERRVGRSGKDSVDHRPSAMDDAANAAAGAVVYAVQSVGLKASFGNDFKECRVYGVVDWAAQCFLLGGQHVPDDPVCRQYCSGMKTALSAFHSYTARTPPEEWISMTLYMRQNFEYPKFAGHFLQRRAEEALGL